MPSTNLESVLNCPACDATDIHQLFSGRDVNQKCEGLFGVAKCQNCGTAFTNPRPPQGKIGGYYPDFYWGDSQLRRPEILANYREIYDWIQANRKQAKTILDIGAGGGYFLSLFDQMERIGVEYSETAAKQGSKKYDLTIMTGNLADNLNKLKKNSFDIITLNHVFEHIYRPNQELRQIKQLLSPDGTLIISVPNFNSLMRRLTRDQWYHLDLPRHLVHYNAKTLRRILTQNGFQVMSLDYCYRVHDMAGFINSLMRTKPGRNRWSRGAIRRSAKVAVPVLELLRLSDVITVYAQPLTRNPKNQV